MVVNKSNIFSETHTQLKAVIDASVTDPIRNVKSSPRKWIYTFIPDVKSQGFQGFPFIVISPPDVNPEKITFRKWEDGSDFEIQVFSLFKDQGSFEDIANEINSALTNTTNITTFSNQNMGFPKIDSVEIEDSGEFNNTRVILRRFNGTFMSETGET